MAKSLFNQVFFESHFVFEIYIVIHQSKNEIDSELNLEDKQASKNFEIFG